MYEGDKKLSGRFKRKEGEAIKEFITGAWVIIAVGVALWYFTIGRDIRAVEQLEDRAGVQGEQAMGSAGAAVERAMKIIDTKI